MYSASYNVYNLTLYMFYFIAGFICISWIAGLFYGKVIVIDLILSIQIIMTLFLTMGILPSNYSSMITE